MKCKTKVWAGNRPQGLTSHQWSFKMAVTRISKLKGFPDIIVGRDLAKVFKEGHVYSIEEIMGMHIIKDLGEYAMPEYHADLLSIMRDGTYLLTRAENEKQWR